jgi:thymidylate synthase
MNTHDHTYAKMLQDILAAGQAHADRTGTGTQSVFGGEYVYDMKDGFPLLTTKKMAWRSIVVELMWFLQGRTDEAWLSERKCTIWKEWATAEQTAKFGRKEGDLGPVYGFLWRHFGATYVDAWTDYTGQGADQIRQLSNDLKNNPGSRRLIVSGWDPNVATRVALPPCHTLWQCKVHADNTLDLKLHQRSADSFLGVPFNIASYSLLLHLLAWTHGFTSGKFIHSFGDLHIYNNHVDQVNQQLAREPFVSPTIQLSDRIKDGGFEALVNFTLDDVALLGYESHDKIAAPVAV